MYASVCWCVYVCLRAFVGKYVCRMRCNDLQFIGGRLTFSITCRIETMQINFNMKSTTVPYRRTITIANTTAIHSTLLPLPYTIHYAPSTYSTMQAFARLIFIRPKMIVPNGRIAIACVGGVKATFSIGSTHPPLHIHR